MPSSASPSSSRSLAFSLSSLIRLPFLSLNSLPSGSKNPNGTKPSAGICPPFVIFSTIAFLSIAIDKAFLTFALLNGFSLLLNW